MLPTDSLVARPPERDHLLVAGGGEAVFGGAVRCDEGGVVARGVEDEPQVAEQAKANGWLWAWVRRPAANALSAGAHDHLADPVGVGVSVGVELGEALVVVDVAVEHEVGV